MLISYIWSQLSEAMVMQETQRFSCLFPKSKNQSFQKWSYSRTTNLPVIDGQWDKLNTAQRHNILNRNAQDITHGAVLNCCIPQLKLMPSSRVCTHSITGYKVRHGLDPLFITITILWVCQSQSFNLNTNFQINHNHTQQRGCLHNEVTEFRHTPGWIKGTGFSQEWLKNVHC